MVELSPLAKMVKEAIEFANWCAGEGICPAEEEGVRDPADILFEYSTNDGDEDWDTLGERVAVVVNELIALNPKGQ